MTKTFELTKGYHFTLIGIASVDGLKVELRYFQVNDDFSLSEYKTCCIETMQIEKLCRKWCEKKGFILWNY